MTTLDNRDDAGQLRSYVRNFERHILERTKTVLANENLDELYDRVALEWGAVWTPDGYTFASDDDATVFLLRWS